LSGAARRPVILGCTEFGMLLEAGDNSMPLIDTTLAHAQAAVDMALQESAARGPERCRNRSVEV
jgi:aspartate racemase